MREGGQEGGRARGREEIKEGRMVLKKREKTIEVMTKNKRKQ